MTDTDDIRVKVALALGWTIGAPITGQGAIHWRNEKKWMAGYNDQRPNYPSDHNAAFTLCARLKSEGWEVCIVSVLGFWNVQFEKSDDEGFEATAPTLPMAICLAFLKVTSVIDKAQDGAF